jgi:hypothetical protein
LWSTIRRRLWPSRHDDDIAGFDILANSGILLADALRGGAIVLGDLLQVFARLDNAMRFIRLRWRRFASDGDVQHG